jgi:Cu(I)/Ag(I) efflux system membrane fusion protein
MHPTIVRDKPDKCPICAMPLSKRKKGEGGGEEALPAGILSRVQLTPVRVAQAGAQTTELTYQPLVKEIQTVGFVEFDERKLARITARPTGKSRIDKLYVNVTGQTVEKREPLAELYSPDLVVTVQNLVDARNSGKRDLMRMARDRLRLWGIADDQIDEFLRANGELITHVTVRSPISGHVIKKYLVEGEYVEEGARLYDVADLSTVWIEAQVYEDEVAFLKDAEKKQLPVRATTRAFPSREFQGKVAFIHPHLDTATRTLRVRFDMDNPDHELRPGMYATVTLEVPANWLVSLSKAGAEDRAKGTAPRHSQLTSVAPNPPENTSAQEMDQRQALLQQGLVLAVPERAVIDTGSRKIVYREYLPNVYEGVLVELGPRMAGPDKGIYYPVIRGLEAGDKVVTTGSFLIDAETRLTAGASSTYFGASAGPQGTDRRSAITAGSSRVEDEDARVKAALGKLSSPDRRLAEAQAFCPVLRDNRLGSMGVPVKVMVKGQPVFLCCAGCKEKALANPDQTLAKVEQLKAKVKGASPK